MASQTELKTAIERVRRVFEARPKDGHMTKVVTVSIEDGIRCRSVEGDMKAAIDMPEVFGGEDSAPNPGFYARTALGSCIAMNLTWKLATRGIPHANLQVRVETDVELGAALGLPDQTPGFTRTRVIIRMESPARREDVEAALAEADAQSPISHLFRHGSELSCELDLVETAAAE